MFYVPFGPVLNLLWAGPQKLAVHAFAHASHAFYTQTIFLKTI